MNTIQALIERQYGNCKWTSCAVAAAQLIAMFHGHRTASRVQTAVTPLWSTLNAGHRHLRIVLCIVFLLVCAMTLFALCVVASSSQLNVSTHQWHRDISILPPLIDYKFVR